MSPILRNMLHRALERYGYIRRETVGFGVSLDLKLYHVLNICNNLYVKETFQLSLLHIK